MVTIGNMLKKQSSLSQKWPNGLAEAMAKIAVEDPDMGPTKLAKLAKENKQTIDRYIKGERKLPKPIAAKLAPLVNSTVADLLQVEVDTPAFERVPLLSWVSAGKMAWQEGIRNVDAKKHLIATDLPKGEWIALRVDGDSMDRIAPNGAVIFVNTTDDALKEDQFYVFSTESGDATFKRYRAGSPPRLQPYSLNPDHETVPAPEGMKVVGRVRRVVMDLK